MCRELWVKFIPRKLSHNSYPGIQLELYFKPRIVSGATPETELTTQRHLEKYYFVNNQELNMPCSMVIYGNKQEMDEDIFDQMVEALHQSNNPHNSPTQATHTRWKPDGSYDKKPVDPDYFSKYYQRKLSKRN
jgi:hypothetical protein